MLTSHEFTILEILNELQEAMDPINERRIKFINKIRHDVSTKPELLFARVSAENKARILLNNKAGYLSESDLDHFLNLCNTELVPPNQYSIKLRDIETITRFQLSFIGQNRKLMADSLESTNEWIKRLWEQTDDYSSLTRFWNENQVPGAGMGLPTMILYLKDSSRFNVWLPFLNKGISIFTGEKISSKRNADNYIKFNETVNRGLREPFNLKPQEIDYILFRINAEASFRS